ncbi:hypothetical protein BJF78_00735 [Pseudonocardia sp. CNS-139]|nr:hypothetical protein BJF78_00735 [Pseudonocardia sp. CNS-139]
MTDRVPTTVAAALADAARDACEFPKYLANHLPMILVALDALGADGPRLAGYAERYRAAKGLVPAAEPVRPITAADWRDHLGDRSRETDYRRFFVAEVGRLGIAAALAQYTGVLADGIGASALHGLMRLCYALLREDPDEVGHALGYVAATYLPAPPLPAATAEPWADPADLVVAVTGMPEVFDAVPRSMDLLWHRIEASFATPAFGPVAARLATGPGTPARMAAGSLTLYAGSNCFTSLHVVTGTFWARVVAAYLDPPTAARLLTRYWQVVLALLPAVRHPALLPAEEEDVLRHTPAPSWAEIAAATVASDDEHDISLVYSAYREHAVYGDPLYKVVAARRVGLVA